jgi:hypothetical protein
LGSQKIEFARLVLFITMGSLVRCLLWVPEAYSETRSPG